MSSSLRVGLLYVDNFRQLRSQRIGSLGLGYLAAWIQQEEPGTEIQIFISAEELKSWQPDLIGISAYTETLPLAREFARELRCLGVPLVLGGAHMASNPEGLPPEFDAGVAGEGEEVFLALVRLVARNAWTPQNLQGLAGVTYFHAGQLVSQGRCPPIQDLDRLAHPDRHLMFAAMQRQLPNFKPILHIHTARGCPYRCSFCSAPLVNPQWRFHSPQWVVEELELIARQFPDAVDITLSDDLFTLKKSRLEELVRAIREAGLHRRFFFFCSSRSNTLTPEMCRLLRDMNVLMISFGFESAADRLIRDLKGVGTHQSDYQRVLELCQRFGIYAHGNFIIGSQHEQMEDLCQTYEFVRDHRDRLASVYFSHMTPFPGTRVWTEAEAAGLIPENLDYRVLDLEYRRGESILLNCHYSEALYEPAYQAFKRLEKELNDRYYREQTFIRELATFERWEWPQYLDALMAQHDWQRVGLLADCEIHLPADSCLQPLGVDPASWPENLQAVVLYHTLEHRGNPENWLQSLPPSLSVVTLCWNAGFYYHWALLLLGAWEEGIYGLRQRQYQRMFTVRTLQRLFEQTGYQMVQFQHHLSRTEPDEPLIRLLKNLGYAQESFLAHSLTGVWLPAKLSQTAAVQAAAQQGFREHLDVHG